MIRELVFTLSSRGLRPLTLILKRLGQNNGADPAPDVLAEAKARAEQAEAKAQSWEAIARRERSLRQDYERALGLSFWASERVSDELWERAQQGDQIAIEVLKVRMARANELTETDSSV